MTDPLQRTKNALNTLGNYRREHPDLEVPVPYDVARAVAELATAARQLVDECERALNEGDWA